MLGQLLARLDAIDNFAADVAHEMKNPLASINSAIQSFTKTEDAADQAALLEIIENDVQRLNRLISDISEASRLDAELGRAAHEPFDMAEMTRKIVPLVSPEITLAAALTQRPEVQLMVSGQKERIGRVLYNLLDNAMSFSPHTKIKVSLSAEEENILLTVEDAGPGLTPGSEEKIFERFYTDRAGGEGSHSGLGLSLSRQIARAHGGDLVAMNRPDEAGAKFLLTLPLASAVKAKTVKNKTAQSKKGASR
jgi:two-component system sensor histidine kinase ChvG